MNTRTYQEENFYSEGSDEIDLIKLFLKIWNGRYLIAAIVSVSAILGFVALKFTVPYYKIESTIDVTSEDQLRSIAPSYLKMSESQAYSADSKVKSVEYQISYPDVKKIYERVLLQVNSIGVMKSFWEKKTGIPLDLRPVALKNDQSKAFRTFYENFSVEPSNPKTPDVTARKVSLVYSNPEQGVKILDEYINFLNEYVWLNYLNNLETAYTANLRALDVNYNALTQIERRRLNDKIIGLRENLKVAESLGIKETPFKELENIQLKVLDGKDYLLGTKPISQQIDILTARQQESLAPFSNELRNLEIWKDQMNSDLERLKSLKGNVRLFSIVNKPESSLDPIKPNKLLIFIAVIFVSGLLGIFIVLIRAAFLEKNLKN